MWESKHSYGLLNLVIGKAFRVPLWFVVSAAVARLLGPDGLGQWSMVLAAGMLLNQLFLHWTQSMTLRFAYGHSAQGGVENILLLRLPVLVCAFALAVLALFGAPDFWVRSAFGISERVSVLLALVAFWMMAETQSLQQVRERFIALAWSPVLIDALLLAVVLVLVFWPGHEAGSLSSSQMIVVLLSVLFLGWAGLFLSELRKTRFAGLGVRIAQLSPMVLFALPLVPGFLIAYLAEWSNYFLIRHFLGEFQLGLFHAGYQYLIILIGIPTALVSVILPRLVRMYDEQGEKLLTRFLSSQAPTLVLLWAVLILIPLALLPWFFGLLLGPEFDAAISVLTVLLIAVPGAMAQHVYGMGYFLRGKLLLSTLLFFLVKLIVDVSLAWSFLPSIGVVASAWSVVISYLVLQWCFLLFANTGGHSGKRGVGVLCWCHVCGVILFLAETIPGRLGVALALMFVSIVYVRQSGFLDAEALRGVMPASLKRFENFLLRLLCSCETWPKVKS
ncbi:MAG: lipopolysaccharide biosynthesis protein [Pseudomonas sp.]|nr:lipopolysaccharide biosynthesis protein [Pseudomonas sp.]